MLQILVVMINEVQSTLHYKAAYAVSALRCQKIIPIANIVMPAKSLPYCPMTPGGNYAERKQFLVA